MIDCIFDEVISSAGIDVDLVQFVEILLGRRLFSGLLRVVLDTLNEGFEELLWSFLTLCSSWTVSFFGSPRQIATPTPNPGHQKAAEVWWLSFLWQGNGRGGWPYTCYRRPIFWLH